MCCATQRATQGESRICRGARAGGSAGSVLPGTVARLALPARSGLHAKRGTCPPRRRRGLAGRALALLTLSRAPASSCGRGRGKQAGNEDRWALGVRAVHRVAHHSLTLRSERFHMRERVKRHILAGHPRAPRLPQAGVERPRRDPLHGSGRPQRTGGTPRSLARSWSPLPDRRGEEADRSRSRASHGVDWPSSRTKWTASPLRSSVNDLRGLGCRHR